MSERPPRPTLTVIEGGKDIRPEDEVKKKEGLVGEMKYMASDPDDDTFDFSNIPPTSERGNE